MIEVTHRVLRNHEFMVCIGVIGSKVNKKERQKEKTSRLYRSINCVEYESLTHTLNSQHLNSQLPTIRFF